MAPAADLHPLTTVAGFRRVDRASNGLLRRLFLHRGKHENQRRGASVFFPMGVVLPNREVFSSFVFGDRTVLRVDRHRSLEDTRNAGRIGVVMHWEHAARFYCE